MFSSMIQNLLSSSGHTSAMQRAVQMNNQINTINDQWIPVNKQENGAINNLKQPSFEKVLQAMEKSLPKSCKAVKKASFSTEKEAFLFNDY